MQLVSVPLSRLVPSKRNPRRVKPAREAHQQFVALIKSQGLIHPLVVQPRSGKAKQYLVLIGNRRLAALKEIHRGNGDPKIPCTLTKADEETAAALSLGENVGREPMHPLDEAEAFAGLATQHGKDAAAIGSEFGVPERYIRQRMKLSALAEPIKAAYRENVIDTATAEAFAAVREDRQLAVWKEVGGKPRNADQVRAVIATAWIDARQAVFDVKSLPESAVSSDLFNDSVLIERKAFLEAQSKALSAEREAMTDEGWGEIILAESGDVVDRMYSMNKLDVDETAERQLAKIASKRQKLDAKADEIDQADPSGRKANDEAVAALESEESRVVGEMLKRLPEETKARTTVFLALDPDGSVRREYRVARRKATETVTGEDRAKSSSDELSDKQLAATFAHQALVVREALLSDPLARKRVLALILHEKARSEALAMRHDANTTTLHASAEGFKSPAFERMRSDRHKVDPFTKKHVIDDVPAYKMVSELSEKKLDAIIGHLVVDLVTAHPARSTALLEHLADELKVNVRSDWMPDADWLSSFQKLQLSHLVTELKGAVHAPAPERKKSELVVQLAKLFAAAAGGTLDDKPLAGKVNAWLPANLRKKAKR